MTPGYVYVLTNPCIQYAYVENGSTKVVSPVKIGIAKDVEKRLGTLNTSLPENFVHHMSVFANDPKAVENVVHRLLSQYRIVTKDGNRTEFFRCSVKDAVETLKQTAKDMHLVEHKIEKWKLKGRASSNIKANARAEADKKRVGAKDVAQGSKQRASASTFEVLFSDGTLIRLPTARDVFVEAIEKFGISRVAKLGFKSFIAKDINLLGVGAKGAAKIGNWYVSTHCSTDAKIKRIESIAKKLGERVEVNKVGRTP